MAAAEARRKTVTKPCLVCSVPVKCFGLRGLEMVRRGSVYCSDSCRSIRRKEVSSATMAATNRKYASKRMRLRNPMKRPEVQEKVRTKLRSMGWMPPVRGGRGKSVPLPQAAMAAALGWPVEVIVPTRLKRSEGHPTHYSLDVGNEALMVAVEVDGGSHDSFKVKARDKRKDDFLRSKGWKVFRFTNGEVAADLAACVRKVLSSI